MVWPLSRSALNPLDDDDPEENEKTKARVLDFLKKQGATSTNLPLNETIEFYQEASALIQRTSLPLRI